MSDTNQQEDPDNNSPIITVNYCPKCREALKSVKFELKDGDVICDYCNNKKICKNYENLNKLRNTLSEIEFICEHFIPDYKYLEK